MWGLGAMLSGWSTGSKGLITIPSPQSRKFGVNTAEQMGWAIRSTSMSLKVLEYKKSRFVRFRNLMFNKEHVSVTVAESLLVNLKR
jgi:hypothetical protein